MRRNNHGSHARVGDLVELLNYGGQPTGITGLVSDVILVNPLGDFDDFGVHRRFLMVTGLGHRIKDSRVVVRSWRA